MFLEKSFRIFKSHLVFYGKKSYRNFTNKPRILPTKQSPNRTMINPNFNRNFKLRNPYNFEIEQTIHQSFCSNFSRSSYQITFNKPNLAIINFNLMDISKSQRIVQGLTCLSFHLLLHLLYLILFISLSQSLGLPLRSPFLGLSVAL
jgi:hypothetical protein